MCRECWFLKHENTQMRRYSLNNTASSLDYKIFCVTPNDSRQNFTYIYISTFFFLINITLEDEEYTNFYFSFYVILTIMLKEHNKHAF